MKVCPKCNADYEDPHLNFCLADGEPLMETESQDAAPTMILDSPRVTNESNWGSGFEPGVSFQNDPPPQNQQIYQPQTGMPAYTISPNKTFSTVSLVLGISSFVFICCYGGFFLGPPAMILGFIGVSKANNEPQAYSGKEMAVIGIILGGIALVLNIIFIFFGILGAILDG